MNAPRMAPILEIDEYGLNLDDHDSWHRPRWSAESDGVEVRLDSWPTDLDA